MDLARNMLGLCARAGRLVSGEKACIQAIRSGGVRAVVLDACASALVEYEGDLWEERFGKDRTFRFCPGYGGSSIADNAVILEEVNASRIGIELLPSGMMAPQKSMAGIIGLGKRTRKTCKDCLAAAGCQFRKEGGTCYRSENDC